MTEPQRLWVDVCTPRPHGYTQHAPPVCARYPILSALSRDRSRGPVCDPDRIRGAMMTLSCTPRATTKSPCVTRASKMKTKTAHTAANAAKRHGARVVVVARAEETSTSGASMMIWDSRVVVVVGGGGGRDRWRGARAHAMDG